MISENGLTSKKSPFLRVVGDLRGKLLQNKIKDVLPR